MPQEKIILKDIMFNKQKVLDFARKITAVYSDFEEEKYTEEVVKKFPELELKQRIHHMKDIFKKISSRGLWNCCEYNDSKLTWGIR